MSKRYRALIFLLKKLIDIKFCLSKYKFLERIFFLSFVSNNINMTPTKKENTIVSSNISLKILSSITTSNLESN